METIHMIPWRYYLKYTLRCFETRNQPLWLLPRYTESFDSIEERDAFIEDMRAKHGCYFDVVELSDNELERALRLLVDKEAARMKELGLKGVGGSLNPGRAQNTDEVLMGRSRW